VTSDIDPSYADPSDIGAATAALTAPGALFEMEEKDVRGVGMRVWKLAPPTLRDVLELSRNQGDADFLVYEDRRTTFAEHYRQAVTLAHRLSDRFGVRKGDRVAIAMRNLPEWVTTFWAVVSAGAVVVPLNAWWTAEELRFGLVDSGATVVIADTERAVRLASLGADLPDLAGLVVVDEGAGAPAAGHAEDRPVDPPPLPDIAVAFSDLLSEVPAVVTPPTTLIDPDDDATIFYTSGTTGRPKGAVGTHRNAVTNLMNLFFVNMLGAQRFGASNAALAEDATGTGTGTQSAFLLSVPLFHVTGCLATMVTNTASGGKLVMLHHFDPERALELIERERITGFGGVPAMVMRILDSPDFERRDLSSVRSVSYGGAPAPPELVRRITQHFPSSQPGNGYGLTETSAMIAMNTGPDYVARPDSVGRVVPVCDVAVLPDTDTGSASGGSDSELSRLTTEPGVVGELWVHGPNVVRGYWGREEETRLVITDGWLHTGDIARIDQDGFIVIVDRAKDVIIRGGENIYTVEVEDVLFSHPAVADCAVIGVPEPVMGEEVGAVVILRPGAKVTADELSRYVARHVARFMVPSHWWFRSGALPRNPAGKVLKRALRQELLAGGSPS